jgi:hypothetical protein
MYLNTLKNKQTTTMKETYSDTKPEFEQTPDIPKDSSEGQQFFATLPGDPGEHDKYERVQIGTGETGLVGYRVKPEKVPVGQEKLPPASYNDMEKGYRISGITSQEIIATTASQLEEMALDLQDRKANGEEGLRGTAKEVELALAFLSSDAIKPTNDRSSIGRMDDEIARLQTRSQQLDHPHQAQQKKQIDQKIRAYTLALDMMQATSRAVSTEWVSETGNVADATGKDITEQQGNVIMAQVLDGHVNRHNERVKRNAERRASQTPDDDVARQKAIIDRLNINTGPK